MAVLRIRVPILLIAQYHHSYTCCDVLQILFLSLGIKFVVYILIKTPSIIHLHSSMINYQMQNADEVMYNTI